jgi:hypothetical protein
LHVYGVYGKTKNIAYVWCGREKMLWERIYIVRKREKMLGNKKKIAHGIRTRTCW